MVYCININVWHNYRFKQYGRNDRSVWFARNELLFQQFGWIRLFHILHGGNSHHQSEAQFRWRREEEWQTHWEFGVHCNWITVWTEYRWWPNRLNSAPEKTDEEVPEKKLKTEESKIESPLPASPAVNPQIKDTTVSLFQPYCFVTLKSFCIKLLELILQYVAEHPISTL